MIIPAGTEIEVDVHGQLSIKTPGNLVLQNSGNYGTIESESGSIRIEPDVQVEAVNIKCADVCYVQGSLTAWKVTARSIELEESARAHIILQETESLQVGREARLVGNFSSEKELFLLFSRFAQQMRSLPFGFELFVEVVDPVVVDPVVVEAVVVDPVVVVVAVVMVVPPFGSTVMFSSCSSVSSRTSKNEKMTLPLLMTLTL